MSLTLFIDDTCPRCRKPVKLSVIEAHPTSRHLAIHNYQCIDCGPVLAKVISLKQDEPSTDGSLKSPITSPPTEADLFCAFVRVIYALQRAINVARHSAGLKRKPTDILACF
jgi:phage FluMu protein Com